MNKMKLLKGFLPLAAAAFLLGSCSDDKFGSDSSSGRAVSFRLQSNLPSSRTTGTTENNINAFVVNAQVHGENGDILPKADGKLFSSQTVARLEGTANAFDYSPKRYYPDEAKTAEFSAYSPVTGKVLYGFNTDSDPDNTITYFVPAPDGDKGNTTQEDLLVAYTPVAGSFDNPVSLNFKHALSRVFVRASNKNVEPVVITKLSLHNLYSKGKLKIDRKDWTGSGIYTPASSEASINAGYKTDITSSGDPAADYKILWTDKKELTSYSYVLPSGVSVPARTEKEESVDVVGKEQGMMVLPQTTVNTGNDAIVNNPDATDGTGDFFVEVTYSISNIKDKIARAAFNDLNGKDGGLTFEMGRQYALTLEFSDKAVEFDITVEPWGTEEPTPAYAATTVVFKDNKPEGVTDDVEHIHNTNSGFIYGKALPSLYFGSNPDPDDTAPSLASLADWFFLGYYDAPEGGTKYYNANLTPAVATWDKIGPSCTLYAQWTDHLWSRSNIYFKPDDGKEFVGSLTFSEDDSSKSGYQGLYFKWGSLIGVAAAETNGDLNVFKEDTYLYIPDLISGKYYKVKVKDVKADSFVEAARMLYFYLFGLNPSVAWYGDGSDWVKIPYAASGNVDASYTRDNHSLTDKSTASDFYPKYMGDICKFLSDKKGYNNSGLKKNWVMPTSDKWKGDGYYHGYTYTPDGTMYKKTIESWSGTKAFIFPSEVADVDGTGYNDTALMTYILASDEIVTFPAAGCRGGGRLYDVGKYGYYWSSSIYGSDQADRLTFYANEVRPYSFFCLPLGSSVRCVRE
jgi:hypothetical protein